MGSSAGGLEVMIKLLSELPQNFQLPFIIVQHRAKDERQLLEEVIQVRCKITVKQADEKEKIKPGTVYFAPADYHLLVEADMSFSLNSDMYVNYSRPSIDVLFETASEVYRDGLLGIILTGSNSDGAQGIKTIRMNGGTTIAQNPQYSLHPFMPQAAINTGSIQYILKVDEIKAFLLNL
ncbi:MAG: glutamate methylesterase [Ignavibacteria bacterium GWB2_35_6b]|nr:MAG: glutamate methylesterase [Ignavibacteria bacterium GWB2_35_6b]